MVWWQFILFPFAILYDLVTRFRNHLFNIGYTPSFDFEVNTIVVGNLSLGGTGKSPMVSFLLQKFGKTYPMATLSRGYGRKSKGFQVASEEMTPRSLGDEPYMFYKRFGSAATVAVGEDRAYAIPAILYEAPATQLIVLDDGFQHRTVKADLNILLTRYDRPFYSDYLLPSGHLREGRSGANRADIIVVTKCPADLEDEQQSVVKAEIARYSQASVYFTTVTYQEPVAFETRTAKAPKRFILVSGIAANDDFVKYCQSTFIVSEVLTFPDHHDYSEKDLKRISALLSQDTGLLTTEKDWVKLEKTENLQGFARYYVPVAPAWLKDEQQFLAEVKNSLKEYPTESFVDEQDH